MSIDIDQVRKDFPILATTINNHALAYLDNAATTHVPREVTDCIIKHYSSRNSNVHRGIHTLSERSTADYEEARNRVAQFINAKTSTRIIFTSGTTESINLVASSCTQSILGPNDKIVVTALEHHANFVPWQMACKRARGIFEVIPLNAQGDIDKKKLFQALNDPRTKMLALCWESNVTGGVNPIENIIEEAHRAGIPVLVDAAQSIRHIPIDVQKTPCDFLCFSGHKVLGPTGIGVLYCSEKASALLCPQRFGGGMVDTVSAGSTTFEPIPVRFEAGTPNYVGAIGLSAALSYIDRIGRDNIRTREKELGDLLFDKLSAIEEAEIIGHPAQRSGIVSFVVDGLSAFDIAKLLDLHGIAVRSGTNCAQPLLASYHVGRVVRASTAFYNTEAEIDRLAACLVDSIQLLRKAL